MDKGIIASAGLRAALDDAIALGGEDPPRKGPEGGWITTFTGKQFSFERPEVDQICIEDIAHHLSMICHWNGACSKFFSVAQHSVLVSRIVPRDLAQWALMHDAAEAYCGDMTRPLKALMPDYKIIEQRVQRKICDVFNLPWPQPKDLKSYDDRILRLESTLYMHPNEVLHDGRGHPVDIPELTPEEKAKIPIVFTRSDPPEMAEAMFLARYRLLFLDDDGL